MDGNGVSSAEVTVAPALVRLLDAEGVGKGLGVLIADREIVTCAHVVNLALGLSGELATRPSAPVQLDFPFVAPGRRYTAEVVAWRSPAPDGFGDVAGLRLHLASPDGVIPCSLAPAEDLYGHRFQVFGFTPAHGTGVWVRGEIRGQDIVGNLQLGGDMTGGPRLTPGFSGAPVWDEVLQAVVGIASRATIGRTPPGGYCLPTKVLVEVWPEIEARTRPACPYRGLLPMREVDAASFFGREQLARRLATQLPQGRLSLLLGPSGCGKSSVVSAGVLPELRRRGDLLITTCRPGVDPFAALATAFTRVSQAAAAGADGEVDSGPERIDPALVAAASETELGALVERLLDECGSERLFLVVDQFEELLTAHPDEIVDGFARAIGMLAVATRPDGRPLSCVVLVARSDFSEKVTEISVLTDALAQGRKDPGEGIHHILPMTADEMRQAVERPVERLRVVRYDDGLVDRLMRDVQRLDNPLAPLAFTLTQLWELQRGGRIPLSAYEAIGEVAGALRIHLDRVYDEELSADDRETARLLLLRMTAPDGRGGHVRSPVRRENLDAQYWNVAQRLASRRMVALLTGPDQTELVELVHDALLEEWPRLREWLVEEAHFLQWNNTLRVALTSWKAANHDARKLLVGEELTTSLAALETWDGRLMSYERDFVKRSEAFQRRVRRNVVVGGTLITLLVVTAIIATATVWVINGRARTEEDIRASQDLVRQVGGSADMSHLAFSLAAYRKHPTDEALFALNGWYQRTALVDKLRPGNLSTAASVVLSPDGQFAMGSWGPQGGEMLWDLEGSAVPDIAIGPAPSMAQEMTGHTFTPDGSYVVYADRKDLVFWHVHRRAVDRRVPIRAEGNSPVYGIAVAPSDGVIAYLRDDSAYAADARTGQIIAGPIPANPVTESRIPAELRFDPTGQTFSLHNAQEEWNFNLQTGQRTDGADINPTDVDHPKCVTVSTGTMSVSGQVDIVVGGKRLLTGLNGECRNYSLGVDRRNDELILVSETGINSRVHPDSWLEIYSLRDGTFRGQFPIPHGTLANVTPSELGARVVLRSSFSHGYVLLRVPPPGSFNRALNMAQSAALTPAGGHVATLGTDGTLSLWEPRTGRRLQTIREEWLRATEDLNAESPDPVLIVSPDSGRVAAFGGGQFRTIDVAAPHTVTGWAIGSEDGWERDPDGYPQLSASFTGAGELVIQAGQVFTRWDTASGRRLDTPMRDIPITFGDYWAVRPGHAQVAIAYQYEGLITIWDFERRAEVAHWRKPSHGDILFNDNGQLMAVEVPDSVLVLDVSNGHEVARLPQFGESVDVDGTSIWESGSAQPVSFVSERQLIVQSRGTYLWTWPSWHIPGVNDDQIRRVPVGDAFGGVFSPTHALTGFNTSGAPGGLLPTALAGPDGWQLLPTNPEQWRASLCALLTEARMDTAQATANAGRSLCGDD